MRGMTRAPALRRRRATSAALYAAMLPETASAMVGERELRSAALLMGSPWAGAPGIFAA
jgi:hypothetical protein